MSRWSDPDVLIPGAIRLGFILTLLVGLWTWGLWGMVYGAFASAIGVLLYLTVDDLIEEEEESE